jgi:hypothetical protein
MNYFYFVAWFRRVFGVKVILDTVRRAEKIAFHPFFQALHDEKRLKGNVLMF